VGHHEGLRTALRRTLMDYVLSGITALFLLVYLTVALLRPERF
jgi:K+-transporting ATPase KdpF subunit